jgi:hypothetical protein
MSIMNLSVKLRILFIPGAGLAIFWLVVLAGFILMDIIALVVHRSKVTTYLGALIPALILAALSLLLVDNFTYTVFKFGISTSTGMARGIYAGLFILLAVCVYLQVLKILGLRSTPSVREKTMQRLFAVSLGLLAISFSWAVLRMDFSQLGSESPTAVIQEENMLPNIILLGSDGVNAQNLSAYGYLRKTTPQLAELAKTSLVAENAFTNAGNTAGSIVSILTSKLPTQTRVLYPPNILVGMDAYQHLPGLLKELGYQTIEYGVPFYVDAYSYNLQNGFDIVNNRRLSVGKLGNLARKLGYEDEVYFLSRLIWRISDRILHIFYMQEMENPFDIATQVVPSISDAAKIDQLLAAIDHAVGPVFIHAHLLGTHGGYYDPPEQLFSMGETQTGPWMDDFYDDTIRAFDDYLGKVIDHLENNGQFNNTILIIYSDHNQEFKVNERVPLIIHFPNNDYANRITRNVENLDISPTILDYLGLPIPDWMNGESMLEMDNKSHRLIYSAGTIETKPNEDKIAFLDESLNKPPFYQFSYIDVIDCQDWYSFDLTTFEWTSGTVMGYVEPCDRSDLLAQAEIKQAVYDRLHADGFDISSLP